MATLTVNYYNGSSSKTVTTTSTLTLDKPTLSGWNFKGWATSPNTTNESYCSYIGGGRDVTVSAGSSNSTLNLYAVFQKDEIYCYYFSSSSSTVKTNTRYIRARYNTSKTEYTEGYNTCSLPAFSSSNSSITPGSPAGTWAAIGWRNDTDAGVAEWSAGGEVKMNPHVEAFYAVYRKTVAVNYNSNGGSGSMSSSTGVAYYNCSGSSAPAEITLKSCSFTSPGEKTFTKWCSNSSGSGTLYAAGSTIDAISDQTLYAIWSAKIAPTKWTWESTVSSGNDIKMTAAEFNRFVDRVFEFLDYVGVSGGAASDYYVTKGTRMMASEVNAVRTLINKMNPPTAVPAAASSGSVIRASFFNGLKNSLNSIE